MKTETETYTIGVISDTHGLLRPEVLEALDGVDMVLHAGDIGGPDIIEKLHTIAPVKAVRGNMDYGAWADDLPLNAQLSIGSERIFLIHDISRADLETQAASCRALVNGHTHQPCIDHYKGLLLLNPGSAGYRRKQYPVSIARLTICRDQLQAELINLTP